MSKHQKRPKLCQQTTEMTKYPTWTSPLLHIHSKIPQNTNFVRGVFRYVFLWLCALINVHNVNERKEICLSQRNQTNTAQMRPIHGKPPFLHHFRFPPRDLLIPVWRHAVKAAALSTDDVTHGSRSHMTGTGNNTRRVITVSRSNVCAIETLAQNRMIYMCHQNLSHFTYFTSKI